MFGYIATPGNAILEWLRMPGDVVFLVGGIAPFLWIAWLGVRHAVTKRTHQMEPETLFVEEHPEAHLDRTGVDAKR